MAEIPNEMFGILGHPNAPPTLITSRVKFCQPSEKKLKVPKFALMILNLLLNQNDE